MKFRETKKPRSCGLIDQDVMRLHGAGHADKRAPSAKVTVRMSAIEIAHGARRERIVAHRARGEAEARAVEPPGDVERDQRRRARTSRSLVLRPMPGEAVGAADVVPVEGEDARAPRRRRAS